ncbi:hypothetical protein E2320_013072 [Naja naja]|nr:hypothetical protein E2320_013072 [Naja naja]
MVTMKMMVMIVMMMITGLQEDGTSALISDAQNLLETQLQLSSTEPPPNVPSSLIKDREGENTDKEEKKGTWDQKTQSGPEVMENSKSFHLKTKAVGHHNASLSPLPKSKAGKELGAEDIQIACSQLTEVRANVSKPARNRHRACDRAVCGESSPSPEVDPVLCVPQLSSSALKTSSDAPKDLTQENRHDVDEDRKGLSDMELQPSEGPGKPMDSLQGTLCTLEVDPDRPVLLNAVGKKPRFLSPDSTVQELGSLSSGRSSVVGSTEVASKTRLPGVPLGNAITEQESKATEMIQTQTKPSPVKPVRFTIAPAWQRSLSGGSSSIDNSCPRNSPTTPVKPELFEGVSPLDAGSQILNTPERSDRANRNAGVNLKSSSEEVQNCESPFGVKLRRTSSLLKYQTEHHWDPPKLVPLAVPSPSSVKIDAKAPNSGANLHNLTTGCARILPHEGPRVEKDTKLPPILPVASCSSTEPPWLSLAKKKAKAWSEMPQVVQ